MAKFDFTSAFSNEQNAVNPATIHTQTIESIKQEKQKEEIKRRKPLEEIKQARINIRMTEKEKEQIEQLAKNEGLTVSTYILRLVRKDAKRNRKSIL